MQTFPRFASVTAARAGVRMAVTLAVAVAATAASPRMVVSQTPQAAANALLAADRAFATAATKRDLIDVFGTMFSTDVIMPVPQGKLARGRDAVLSALRTNPAYANAHAEWAPVSAGVSADGQHGFTFGFTTLHRGDGSISPGKYLAYWVKQPDGWHVAAYKRGGRPEGTVRETMPPSLPAMLVPPATDAAVIEAHRASLIAAEKGFSDLANAVGLGNAFRATGRVDAINLGGQANADFVYGNDAIARLVSGDAGMDAKPFTWSADTALVASSGDLGVTFGVIHQNDGSQIYSFFTVWRRDGPNGDWKYIAE
jgi:ketosteroid isomerase-like protein